MKSVRNVLLLTVLLLTMSANAKTLIVYYSYTNNVHRVVTVLKSQIADADVVRIEPAEKGLDYAANNYAIGSSQIAAIRNNPNSASSYPAIDPVDVNLDDYSTIIIGAPLWWSQMAAPLQTYLFNNGAQMAGKNIGLIVSSASSGISSVEQDAKRLVPNGKFFSESLWVRSSQVANSASLVSDWLEAIDYNNVASVDVVADTYDGMVDVYNLSGEKLLTCNSRELSGAEIENGIYLIVAQDDDKPFAQKIIINK